MNFKRLTAIALMALCVAGTMTGCANSKKSAEELSAEEQAAQAEATLAKEIKQNDYRGAVTRTTYLKDAVLQSMENMKTNNATLRTDNPNSFWTTDGYQDFVVNFLSIAIINDGQWFNEEETEWETAVKAASTTKNSFTKKKDEGYTLKANITFTRNEKDDYSVSGVPFAKIIGDDVTEFKGSLEYRFLYDCDKDWAKAYTSLPLDANRSITPISPEMYEYCRLDNDSFVIQTSRERLYVVFEPVEFDTDFRERQVKEFYYSKLTQDGMRTTFTPYEPISEYDEETGKYDQTISQHNKLIQGYHIINDKGDLANQYGKNDSIFLTDDIAKCITPEWVFEDKALQQAICYKDKALVVTTYNKLSEKYERFIYSAESVKDEDIKALEAMVSIEGLVGEQEIPEIEIPAVDVEAYAKPTEPAPTEAIVDEAQQAIDDELKAMREQAEAREDGDVEAVESVAESDTAETTATT